VLFNSDNNGLTGQSLAGRVGVDHLLTFTIAGGNVVSTSVQDLSSASTVFISGSHTAAGETFTVDSGLPGVTPGMSLLEASIPTSFLSFTGGNFVPTTFVSGDLFAPDDIFDMPYMVDQSLDPAHTVVAPTGQWSDINTPFPLIASGFAPNTLVNIFADDTLLGTAVSDGLGMIATTIAGTNFGPGFMPNDYFITMQEASTGDFGYTVVYAVPAPGAIALGTLGALFAGRRRRSA
jgi:hypothetical protein